MKKYTVIRSVKEEYELELRDDIDSTDIDAVYEYILSEGLLPTKEDGWLVDIREEGLV